MTRNHKYNFETEAFLETFLDFVQNIENTQSGHFIHITVIVNAT